MGEIVIKKYLATHCKAGAALHITIWGGDD